MRYLLALAVASVAVAAQGAEPRTIQEATIFTRDYCKSIGPSAYGTRYLWLPRQGAKQRKEWWQVCSGWIHGQSREKGIYPPPVIVDTPQGPQEFPAFLMAEDDWARAVLVKVQLSLYRFNTNVWEKFGFQHPYSYRTQKWTGGYDPTSVPAPWMADAAEQLTANLELQKMVGGVVALLRADNWFWQTAIVKDRVVGYHGLLEIKNQKDYERLIGYDPNANIDKAFFDEILAGIAAEDSKVAINSRRIEIRNTMGGLYLLTKDNSNTDSPRKNPLKTFDGTLEFEAIESFGHSVNGFWITGLFNNKGASQQVAPTNIAGNKDTLTNDVEIHNGLSCFECHDNGGLKDLPCRFRSTARGDRGLFTQTTVFSRIPALLRYLPPLEPYLDAGRQRYATALWQATALKPQEYASLLGKKYREYDGGVDINRAAADLGTTPQETAARIQKYVERTGGIDLTLAPLYQADNKKISIRDWHTDFNKAALAIRGLVEWPKK